jgi:O-antigen/teichoic acid export membrane protein
LFYGFWVLAISGAYALLESSSGDLQIGFWIPFLFLLSFATGMILESVLIVFKNIKTLAFINFLYACSFCLIHKMVLEQGFSYKALFLSLLALTLLKTLIYGLIACIRIIRHRDDGLTTDRSATEIRKLWIHLGFYDILQMIFGGIDRFTISLLLSSELSAIYYNGSVNVPFLPVLLSAAGSAVLIQLVKVQAENEKANLVKLMNHLALILSAIVFPVFFFLLFYSYDFFAFFLPGYARSVPIFLVYLFVLPLKAYSFTTPLQKLHRGAIINIGAIADLIIAFSLIYPLYKWLGLPGVALSFVISTWLQATYYLICSARLLGVSPLKMLPWSNWLLKLSTYGLLFLTIHSVTKNYFTGKIPLFLGGILVLAVIAISLTVEFKKEKKYGGS